MNPIVSTDIAEFLAAVRDDPFVLPVTDSPIHILFPDKVAANCLLFETVYRDHSLQPHIYYAFKANKSPALLRSAHRHTKHVEVSSRYELSQVLAVDFTGGDVLASGPLKSDSYLQLCVIHDVLISIDDLAELNALVAICGELGKTARVLLRINYPGSKFGIPLDGIRAILTSKSRYRQCISLTGYSFHINNYSIEDRWKWLAAAIDLVELAKRNGHEQCTAISIGGGFTVNYVTTSAWQDWQKRCTSGEFATYNGKHLSSAYPYYSTHPKERFLDAVLKGSTVAGNTLADVLRAKDIDLIIEPGRSLLDQAGITIFSVNGTKQHVSSCPLTIVEGNINSLSEPWFGSDFLTNPLLLARPSQHPKPTESSLCYIGGNLCLENDMLATRPVPFDSLPARGDRLAYVNTAGYQMDSNESDFAHLPIPKKFIATKHNNIWRLQLDEDA